MRSILIDRWLDVLLREGSELLLLGRQGQVDIVRSLQLMEMEIVLDEII
jgi:hypothetical protein